MRLPINSFGGINQVDEEAVVYSRAYRGTENGFSQIAPLESRDLVNCDFSQEGIRKRKGSIEYKDFTTSGLNILIAQDLIVSGVEWVDPATGNAIELIVSKKTIYTNQSGEFVQVNDSSSVSYTHASDVSLASFAEVDGHLFIGLNGADNYIQVYRSGADLDDEMVVGNTYEEAFSATTHVITGTWAKATYLVSSYQGRLIYSTGNTVVEYTPEAFTASSGIWDLTNGGFVQTAGNIRSLTAFAPDFADQINESLYIGTETGFDILTGFTASDKLVRLEGGKIPLNHRCVVKSLNWLVYMTEDKDIMAISGSNVINLGRRLRNYEKTGHLDRLLLSKTKVSGYGFYDKSKSQVIFGFSRDTSISFVSTIDGGTSTLLSIDGGAAPSTSYGLPTDGGSADTTSFSNSVDGGDVAGAVISSPVFSDSIDGGAADTTTFSDSIDGGVTITNSDMSVIDMSLGEPVVGETQTSYEQRVRCLFWEYTTATSGGLYVSMFQTQSRVIGVNTNGFLYELSSGFQDTGSVNINTTQELTQFNGGSPSRIKQWIRHVATLEGMTSSTVLNTAVTIDRKGSSFKNKDWQLVESETKELVRHIKINAQSRTLKVTITSTDSSEWIIYNMALLYEVGAEILG